MTNAHPPPDDAQSFRLYVSGASPLSVRAIANARRFLEETLPGSYTLVVLNITEHVEAARADQIVALPTLLRLHPSPPRRLIGDLSDTSRMRLALGLGPAQSV